MGLFFLFTVSIAQSVRSIPGKVDFFFLLSLSKRPDRLWDYIGPPTQQVVTLETRIRHEKTG